MKSSNVAFNLWRLRIADVSTNGLPNGLTLLTSKSTRSSHRTRRQKEFQSVFSGPNILLTSPATKRSRVLSQAVRQFERSFTQKCKGAAGHAALTICEGKPERKINYYFF